MLEKKRDKRGYERQKKERATKNASSSHKGKLLIESPRRS